MFPMHRPRAEKCDPIRATVPAPAPLDSTSSPDPHLCFPRGVMTPFSCLIPDADAMWRSRRRMSGRYSSHVNMRGLPLAMDRGQMCIRYQRAQADRQGHSACSMMGIHEPFQQRLLVLRPSVFLCFIAWLSGHRNEWIETAAAQPQQPVNRSPSGTASQGVPLRKPRKLTRIKASSSLTCHAQRRHGQSK
jgi:hypothetical protein